MIEGKRYKGNSECTNYHSWFYPFSGIINVSSESQYFGNFFVVCYLMRLMIIDSGIWENGCASANMGTWPSLISTPLYDKVLFGHASSEPGSSLNAS